MAQIILENMLQYAGSSSAPAGKLAVVQERLPMGDALNEVDAVFTDLSGKLADCDLQQFPVLLAETDCAEVLAGKRLQHAANVPHPQPEAQIDAVSRICPPPKKRRTIKMPALDRRRSLT